MDFLESQAGLLLIALVGAAAAAAGVLSWIRERSGAGAPGRVAWVEAARAAGSAEAPPQRAPLSPQAPDAPGAAARAVIDEARTRAGTPLPSDEATHAAHTTRAVPGAPVPSSLPVLNERFDGPAWAPTEPMPGLEGGSNFADTMPAEVGFAPTSYADTMPAEMAAGR